ncbi:MAG: hypothetical protein V2A34_03030, partial [Lentisphaerota bacterium]
MNATTSMTMDSRALKWALVVVLICVAAPYLTGLHHPFVYDDYGVIVENGFLQNPSRMIDVVIGSTISDPGVIDGRRPMVVFTYFLDRLIWGLYPDGYHITNLALHLGCAGLFFGLIRKLGGGGFFMLAATLLFGLHPVLTEAVQIPAFREDLLCAFFLLLYLRMSLSPRPIVGLSANLFLIFAVLSKETAMIGPGMLLAFRWYFPSLPKPPRSIIRLQFLLGLLIVCDFITILSIHPSIQGLSVTWNGLSLLFPENFFTAPWLWLKWLRLLLIPVPLLADYSISPVTKAGSYPFLLGMQGLMLAALVACFLRKKHPFPALAFAW